MPFHRLLVSAAMIGANQFHFIVSILLLSLYFLFPVVLPREAVYSIDRTSHTVSITYVRLVLTVLDSSQWQV